jgi:GT2 family glycosyltransferase
MTAQAQAPRTTIVIATRDRRDELLVTLTELDRAHPGVPTVVVDNGSSDGTPSAVRQSRPGVMVISLAGNHGAVARNVGVLAATTPYVAFADDDSWWDKGALAAAELAFDTHPDLGLIAARTLVGPEERPDPITAELAASPLERTANLPWPRLLGFLCCSAIVRRQAFLQAGGFSPILHFVGEERLLAWDLAAAGWACCYVEDIVAHHHPSTQRSGQVRRHRQELRNQLLATWLRRHPARGTSVTLSLLGDLRRDPEVLPAVLAALRKAPDVLRGRRRLPLSVERMVRLVEGSR